MTQQTLSPAEQLNLQLKQALREAAAVSRRLAMGTVRAQIGGLGLAPAVRS